MSVAAAADAEQLGLRVELHDIAHLGLTGTSCTAVARTATGPDMTGFGAGRFPEAAARAAVMECVERSAQFAPAVPPAPVRATADELGPDALAPPSLGLYDEAQYADPGFGLAPFAAGEALDWVGVAELGTGRERLVPVEFIHPHLPLDRPALVAETSCGTAAHTSWAGAVLAALCEALERDGLMLFWHRQPATPALPVESVNDGELRDALRAVQALGFVVATAILGYDLDVPRFLVVALRDREVAYGLGCHPDAHTALGHAVRELHARVASLGGALERSQAHRSLRNVRAPADHYALYHRGPLHDVLRDHLARVLEPGAAPAARPPRAGASDGELLDALLGILATHGYRAYARDLTPPAVEASGARVARVLVPGLVPLHFGFDRARLGCQRLTGADAPGRLATLLPHFIA